MHAYVPCRSGAMPHLVQTETTNVTAQVACVGDADECLSSLEDCSGLPILNGSSPYHDCLARQPDCTALEEEEDRQKAQCRSNCRRFDEGTSVDEETWAC